MPSKYLIVEDHPLYAEALNMILKAKAADNDVTLARTLKDAKAILETRRDFEMVLLDLRLSDCQGFEGLIALRNLYPKLPIVVVSAFTGAGVRDKSIVFGAAAFISKAEEREQILETLVLVENRAHLVQDDVPGGPENGPAIVVPVRNSNMTMQQMRVLQSICLGLQNKQIARELDIAETTVKAHVSEILRKLGVSSRTQAVLEVSRLESAALQQIRTDEPYAFRVAL